MLSSSSSQGRRPRRGRRRAHSARRPCATTPSERSAARSSMNAATCGVLPRPHGLRQGRVGDVADQDVLEGVLVLAGEPASRRSGRRDPFPRARRVRRQVDALVVPRARSASRPRRSGRPRMRAGATRRSGGASASSRAASTRVHRLGQRPAVLATPPRAMRLTISSANSGLPAERSAICGDELALPLTRRRRRAGRSTSSRVSSAVSGSSEIVVAFRRPPPQPGRRSSSSSRARQTIRTGPRIQRARYSIRSSIPSSAQWMSSMAITSGRAGASGLDQRADRREEAVAHLLRVLGVGPVRRELGGGLDAERPGDGRRDALRAARRSRSSATSRLDRRGASLAQAGSRVVGVDDLELPADDLAERPVGQAGAVGRAAPDRERRAVLAVARAARRARAAAATCRRPPGRSPSPGAGAPRATTRSKSDAAGARARRSRPTSGASRRVPPGRRAPRDERRTASQAGTGSALPFSVSGSSSLVLDRVAGQRGGWSRRR